MATNRVAATPLSVARLTRRQVVKSGSRSAAATFVGIGYITGEGTATPLSVARLTRRQVVKSGSRSAAATFVGSPCSHGVSSVAAALDESI